MKHRELIETERLLRKVEIAAKLGVSKRTIDRRIAAGLFPKGMKFGASVRWRESLVDRWIEEGCPRVE